MNTVQIADQPFIAAAPAEVGSGVADPGRWRAWWPELRLEVRESRGEKGVRWAVDGHVRGTMEVWLKPEMDGTLLHFFLHAEPVSALSLPALRKLVRELRVAGKRMSFELKDRYEAGKSLGEPPRQVSPPTR
jgi:hypothetical protein